MSFQLFVILIFLTRLFTINADNCYNYLIDDTAETYTCSSSGSFSATSPVPLTLKSPYKQLTVALTIMLTDLCSASSSFNFLTVSITPTSTSGVSKNVMILSYSAGVITWSSEDASGTKTAYTMAKTTSSLLNKPFNTYLSVTMTSGSNGFTGGGVVGTTIVAAQITSATTPSVTYGSDWVFDSTLQFSVCSNSDGSNAIGCKVQNLKIVNGYYTVGLIINFASQVTMLGDYKLNDESLANSQGTLAAISLSTSAPTWISETGLKFTSTSQYIQLPGFIPSASDLTITASVAFTFYIKVDTAPSSADTIFSYVSSTVGTVFCLQVTSAMKLQNTINTKTQVLNTVSLTLGEWAMIYVAYDYLDGGLGVSMVYVNGVEAGFNPSIASVYGASTFSTSDIVKVGGFLGQIRRLQVYSPAAYQATKYPCDPSTCALEIGFNNPSVCIETICSTAGEYVSFGTCESCLTGCATCTNPTKCQSCTSKYYLDGTSCPACPTECATCTDATTCQSCVAGYYLDGTACKSCPIHCKTCTDAQTCTSCNSGYGIYNNFCMLCPSGTYLDSSSQKCSKLSTTVQDTLTNSQLVSSAATQAASIISQGSVISLSAAVSGKIFSQIRYLNISYSGQLEVALLTWKSSFVSLDLTPDMPESMEEKIPERQVPYVFEKYDVPSSFLENFWENLGVVIFVTFLWLLLYGGERTFKKPPLLVSISRKGRLMIQNFLITSLFGVYGDLVMYSIIEYRSFAFGWNLSLLSFCISVILLIVMFGSFWYQTRILTNYQKIKKQGGDLKKFTKANEGSQVLFKDMKDYSIAPQLFTFFLSGRDLLVSLILATMFEYPLAQTLIFTILYCLMIAYLFIKKPFESTFDMVQQLFFEFISLIVTVTICINAILDTGDYEAVQSRYNIGKLVIICNFIFNSVTAIFMLIFIIQTLVEFYKEFKRKRAKKVKDLTIKTRLPTTSAKNPQMSSDQNFMHESVTSNNIQNLETSSLHREIFDISLLPSQVHIPTPSRRLRKNPACNNSQSSFTEPQNSSSYFQSQEESQRYVPINTENSLRNESNSDPEVPKFQTTQENQNQGNHPQSDDLQTIINRRRKIKILKKNRQFNFSSRKKY